VSQEAERRVAVREASDKTNQNAHRADLIDMFLHLKHLCKENHPINEFHRPHQFAAANLVYILCRLPERRQNR
jgi:hypothetical protein